MLALCRKIALIIASGGVASADGRAGLFQEDQCLLLSLAGGAAGGLCQLRLIFQCLDALPLLPQSGATFLHHGSLALDLLQPYGDSLLLPAQLGEVSPPSIELGGLAL